ncbi:hypothetical protein VTK73DRAFT_8273 [Phialemonium thermophilum]|uniref:DNA polymerase delta subunit 4 n=1 Tax=Phialemonium thermophilum TaxID=223376 RepID=A0ABR3WA56_9PEZI
MPTTRRSSSGRAAASQGRQSTLTFTHRVTKSVPKSSKDLAKSAAVVKDELPGKASREASEVDDLKTTEPEPEPRREDEEEQKKADQDENEAEEEEVQQAVSAPPPPPQLSDAEIKAEKISDAAIERYWRALEAQRMAKRVHQEDLSTGEKILRYFDVSSQYGPCIGISRIKRWQRAEKLGLNPPIEVLAVLLKEERKGNTKIERAHVDEIMNSGPAVA